jgi:hypothetical protein
MGRALQPGPAALPARTRQRGGAGAAVPPRSPRRQTPRRRRRADLRRNRRPQEGPLLARDREAVHRDRGPGGERAGLHLGGRGHQHRSRIDRLRGPPPRGMVRRRRHPARRRARVRPGRQAHQGPAGRRDAPAPPDRPRRTDGSVRDRRRGLRQLAPPAPQPLRRPAPVRTGLRLLHETAHRPAHRPGAG